MISKLLNKTDIDYIMHLKKYVDDLEIMARENPLESKIKAIVALIATGVINEEGKIKNIVSEPGYICEEEASVKR